MATHRALQWLHTYGRRYPGAWEGYARLQADPPMEWPAWCWMPLAGTYAILSGGGDGTCSPEQTADLGVLGGLAAWRPTQGIYRFDDTLRAELLATPIAGDLPADVLKRLPAWCVYVETPGHTLWGAPLHGFWGYCEHDANTGRGELRLVLDTDILEHRPACAIVHLGSSLAEGVRAAFIEARIQALRSGAPQAAPSVSDSTAAADGLDGLVSLLLYLCADEADTPRRLPKPPKVVQGRKRPLCPAAKAPAILECGYRVGAAIRAAREAGEDHGARASSGVTPHVRRAHWHTYWTGPRDGDRRTILRWLSPALVGFEGTPEFATLRPVKAKEC